MLTCIGEKGREIYNTLTFDAEADKMKLQKIIKQFDMYCETSHRFFRCKQMEEQRFDEYLTELKKRALDCEFGDLREDLIKDILICGINDDKLRERLLRRSR